jgi:hypothetical protein
MAPARVVPGVIRARNAVWSPTGFPSESPNVVAAERSTVSQKIVIELALIALNGPARSAPGRGAKRTIRVTNPTAEDAEAST